MNRNSESHFATNPTTIDLSRSKMPRPQHVITTFNVGDIIPYYVDEVLPGDTFQVDTSKVVRLQTLMTPIMDNIYLDTYYFFVPNRLVWQHWREFCGENTQSAWIPQVEYSIPQVEAPATGWEVGTIADYMGIPTDTPNISVTALPFRAYALICQDWFRSEVVTDPLNIPVNDSTQAGSNGSNYINDIANGGKPFKACKYFDYFSAALPSPQKGPDVTISLTTATGPVYGDGNNLKVTNGTTLTGLSSNASNGAFYYGAAGANYSNGDLGSSPGVSFTNTTMMGVPTKTQVAAAQETVPAYTTGLIAEINNASLITINQLREAFQIQKFYERQARGGSRYIELLKSMFGVTSPDARLQRPEYLGGNRIPITVNQVIQNSETSASGTPQGTTTAYSLTTDVHSDFTHSFTEHGYVIGLMVARYDHTYQQGIERFWSRKTKFDFYWPVFANLGEQAIKNKEIFAQGSTVLNPNTGKAYDEEVFGYQEAWADYRYKPSRVSGEMRSSYSQSLDIWHLADDYQSLPTLSDSWIREDSSNVDRVIAVSQQNAHQILADIYVKNMSTRCMPIYSIPGLIDHH